MQYTQSAYFARRPPTSVGALLIPWIATLAMVGASTIVGHLMVVRWGTSAVDMIYLPAVLAAAALFGLGPGFAAALGSALAYNFFFTEPFHTFRITRPADIVTVAILFLVALVTSQLAARMRSQARAAGAHAARNATIAGLARRLLSCSSEAEIGSVACHELVALFDCNAVLVSGLPKPKVIAAEPEASPLTPSDLAAAALVLESGEPAGHGTARVDPAEWQFHPVSSRLAVLAAMGLARDDGAPPVSEEHLPLLSNLLDQVALALERARFEAETRGLDDLRERDRLRGALLSSVGHDLRTPLTAIIAAAGELRRGDADPALVAAVGAEAAKLERYISNLLDMARIEAGAVNLKTEAVDLVDAVSAAIRDLHQTLDGHPVHVALADNLPLVRTDPHLLHHCLINLLDNAGRHSGSSAPIHIIAREENGGVALSIEDEGPGLAVDDGAPFDAFAQIRGSDQTGGTGLGLAIVKAFSAALGIEAIASRRDQGGAAFTLRFPRHLALSPVGADGQ
jgi:two-component system sensor histidine kinase KdpD